MSKYEYNPQRCHPDIFKNGHMVFLTHTLGTDGMNEWIKALRETSGQPIDWHFAGGRARVLALGDIDEVRKAIVRHRDLHDEKYLENLHPTHRVDGKEAPCMNNSLQGIWSYNGM